MPAPNPDLKRIENLTVALMREVQMEYRTHAPSQASVHVVLKSLATVVGTVLAGTGAADEAVNFFHDELAKAIVDGQRMMKEDTNA